MFFNLFFLLFSTRPHSSAHKCYITTLVEFKTKSKHLWLYSLDLNLYLVKNYPNLWVFLKHNFVVNYKNNTEVIFQGERSQVVYCDLEARDHTFSPTIKSWFIDPEFQKLSRTLVAIKTQRGWSLSHTPSLDTQNSYFYHLLAVWSRASYYSSLFLLSSSVKWD